MSIKITNAELWRRTKQTNRRGHYRTEIEMSRTYIEKDTNNITRQDRTGPTVEVELKTIRIT